MLLQSSTDFGQIHQDQIQENLGIRTLKPKLITSLNYQQQYLIRRKNKRNKKRQQLKQNYSNNHIKSNQTILRQIYSQTQETKNKKCFKQVYDGNDKIIGNWENGLLQGQAQVYYQNGDYFKGIFKKGYKITGKMVFNDQAQYQGKFQNQIFHGKGVLKLKDKSITAIWANGIAENNCIVQYKKGNLYYGPLKQFKKHGYGYLYFLNDTKFFGEFIQGQIKGYGQFYEKGKLKFKGIWLNGKLIKQYKLQEQFLNYCEEKYSLESLEQLFAIYNKKQLGNCLFLLGTASKQFKLSDKSEEYQQKPFYKDFNQNANRQKRQTTSIKKIMIFQQSMKLFKNKQFKGKF